MPRLPRTPEPSEIVTLDLKVEPTTKRTARTGLKILLLEDRSDYRQVLHDYLGCRLHQVTSVQTGVEGLREIMKGPFDIIVCDMLMPKMGGEMFYWAVTRIRRAAGQRFIFFTGHTNNPTIEFFFRRINATVLYKPFELSALDAAIAKVFRKLA